MGFFLDKVVSGVVQRLELLFDGYLQDVSAQDSVYIEALCNLLLQAR